MIPANFMCRFVLADTGGMGKYRVIGITAVMAIKDQRARIILAMCCLLAMVGCDQSANENNPQSSVVNAEAQANATKETATLYSFDNPEIKSESLIGAFPPNDPRYMTIALRSQPGAMSGNIVRFPDPGEGVRAKVLSQQEWLGNIWYEVEAQGHVGWIAEHLIILDSK